MKAFVHKHFKISGFLQANSLNNDIWHDFTVPSLTDNQTDERSK
jgi:hypothetical protein